MQKDYTKEDRSKQALEKILEMFRSDAAPAAIARTMIRRLDNDGSLPSDTWSINNQILMLISGTEDARGFKQWEAVGRKVKKGAKAIYILGPCVKKFTKEEKNETTGEVTAKEFQAIVGFKAIPVFRYEDTEGEELPTRSGSYNPDQLPPLYDVAQQWGIKVVYAPGGSSYYGCTNGKDNIKLCTHEEKTFYHELSHCAHSQIRGGLKGGQHADQEIVAEFSAAVLAEMYGGSMHGNSWDYIKGYSGHDANKALKNIFALINEIEQVISLILATANDQEAAKVA